MSEDIYDALTELRYDAVDEVSLKKAIAEGPKSIQFTKLVEWVSKELQFLYSLDEHVNAITSPDDSSSFLMELSSFLKELGCQYSDLLAGRVNDRLRSESNRILVLDYLLTELKSARMTRVNKPDTALQVTLNESSTAVDLKKMLQVLKFPKPPANIPPKILFSKVESKLKECVSKVPVQLYGEPLFVGTLSDKQWHILENFYKDLFTEYRIRREMLLKRLDVTIQSFEWSDRLKTKSSEIHNSFLQIRNALSSEPDVRLSDLLAARKDLAILEKTSSASVRRKTQSDVNKVVIGSVPDRGGRPYEQEPPPPEMPSWQQRSNTGGPSRGGRGGGRGQGPGRGSESSSYSAGGNSYKTDNFNRGRNADGPPRGGRVQAGWSGPPQGNFQSAYESSGNYSKPSGYQSQSNYGNNSGQYQGRGGHQNYGQHDTRTNQDHQNRNDGSRNYYNRR